MADPNCPFCQGSGYTSVWDINPDTDEYAWIKVECGC